MLMAKEGSTGAFLTKMVSGAEVMKDYPMRFVRRGTALCNM